MHNLLKISSFLISFSCNLNTSLSHGKIFKRNMHWNLKKLHVFSVLSSKAGRKLGLWRCYIAPLIVRAQCSIYIVLPSWYCHKHGRQEILIVINKTTKASTKVENQCRDSFLQSRFTQGALPLADSNLNQWQACFSHILAAASCALRVFQGRRFNIYLVFSSSFHCCALSAPWW